MTTYEGRFGELPDDRLDSGAEGQLLDDVQQFIARFCAFPDEHCLAAVTLWAAHTHMVDRFHTTPRLALLSPEPESGKSRVLEILELLVPDPMLSVGPSPAAIFRTLDKQNLTLLFDEADTVWRQRGKEDCYEDLRMLMNAGYRRGATIPRCTGPQHDVHNFPVFCAVALAGLGELPETILTRSVIIRMRRRAPGEVIESFRPRLHDADGHALRDRLAGWAPEVGPRIGDPWPKLPEGVEDRPAEVWEPLVSIADLAGGDWPDLAREACSALVQVAEDRRVSLGVRLLADLRVVFEDSPALHTQTIIKRLTAEDSSLDDDAPWASMRGSPLDSRGLARLLKPYGIASCSVRVNGTVKKGYRREDLNDAWQRYLAPPSGKGSRGSQGSQALVCHGIEGAVV